jgi:heterodisulfide reductase subunit B
MHATRSHLQHEPALADHINYALEADNLKFEGSSAVRHLIEIYVQDIGLAAVKTKVTHSLKGLRVAPYYGCQILRPRKDHEDVEQARFFEDLMAAIGATPVDFPMKLRCCGGALIITNRKAALSLVRNLLQNATDVGAQVIATACPLCQVNLECYQKLVNQEFGANFNLPVMYFTQLIGLAFGLPPKQLGIGTELTSTEPVVCHARSNAS